MFLLGSGMNITEWNRTEHERKSRNWKEKGLGTDGGRKCNHQSYKF